jgi:hypothetical protein
VTGHATSAGPRVIVSCQSTGAGNTATVANISTGDSRTNTAGDSKIDAR